MAETRDRHGAPTTTAARDATGLWLLFFCAATMGGLLLQKVGLPLVPALDLGRGLMQPDAVSYHAQAAAMAQAIAAQGWSALTLEAAPGHTGNVALLAALYALFRPDPALLVPVTAALHATCGVLVFLIGRRLWPGPTGHTGGIVGALLYVLLPSALTWYGQPLKDTFSATGVLLVAWSWLWATSQPASARTAALAAAGTAAGVALVLFVRPYLAVLTATAAIVALAAWLCCELARGARPWSTLRALVPALLVAGLAASWAGGGAEPALSVPPAGAPTGRGWIETRGIPERLERYAEAAAQHRATFVALGEKTGAGSMIDTHARPDSVPAILAYLPRALQIALFAPFPSEWTDLRSPARAVGVLETVIFYLALPGVLIALRAGRTPGMAFVAAYAVVFLAALAFLNPNLGTLHRLRYPFLMLTLLIGVLGWAHAALARRHARRARHGAHGVAPHVEDAPEVAGSEEFAVPARAGLAAAGLTVVALALLANVGFFARDLVMARQFGLGAELDAFVIAMMLPMFLVTVFSIPLGTAIVPAYLAARDRHSPAAAQALASTVSLLALAVPGGLALALYVALPALLPRVASGFSAEAIARTTTLAAWALPILATSAAVVLGSGLLNARQRFAAPAWGQAMVPAAAIAALALFGTRHGAAAAIAGMFAGQLAHLAVVARALKREGLTLAPRWRAGLPALRALAAQYLPLVAAAVLVNAAGPIGSAMAATLAAGSVAALGIGSKIVLFITGIVGTAVSTVMLPYFAAHLARRRVLAARRELSFFLVAGMLAAIPVSLACYLAAEPLTALAIAGGAVTAGDVRTVAQVMQLGIVQLPLFTCNVILLRYAVASHRSGRILAVSAVALAVNVVLNLALMRLLGVAGIALATTLATAVSALLMLVLLHRAGDVGRSELQIVVLTWLLFLTLVLCLHHSSPLGVPVAAAGIVLAAVAYWREARGGMGLRPAAA